MSEKTLNHLSEDTIKLIASTQIITSVSTAVKELVENSLDADAKSIQVRLENYGFDLLEVKDDGYGISSANVQKMFLPGYTSKISCFGDLVRLETYGFRGEALSALAKLSNISITTKTPSDTLAMTFVINNDGVPESSKPSHIVKGTILTAAKLFHNLPVRKMYLSSKRKASEEIKKVEHVVQSLAAIHPELRITLFHNRNQVWQKNSVRGIKQSFMQVVGLKTVSNLEHLNELNNNIAIDLIVPKKKLGDIENILTNSKQNIFAYINKRPVVMNKISKVVMDHIFHHYRNLNQTKKYSICLISVEVPPQELDVNLEPNKTKVLLKNEVDVIKLIDQVLGVYYEHGSRYEPEVEPQEEVVTELKDDDDDEEKEENDRKRLCTEDGARTITNNRNKDLTQKNSDWKLKVIRVDDVNQETKPLSLCSQINSNNCMLTTREELGELRDLMSKNNQKLVANVNVDTEMRAVDRDEIQSHDRVRNIAGYSDSNIEVQEVSENMKLPVESDNNLIDLDALDKIDMTDWSKGVIGKDTLPGSLLGDGEILQGGVVLARPNVLEESTSEERVGESNVAEEKRLEEDADKFDLSMQSISSQLGKKELSAFTKFASIMRPKVLQEFPGLLFTKVAVILSDRWKALSEDEKDYYAKLAKVVDQKRKIHQESKSVDKCFESKSPVKKKCKDKKPVRFELKITTSLSDIMKVREKKCENERVRVIGQLQPSGNWLYKKGNEIGHVRHHGLHELILSQRMLADHSVPVQPVLKPVFINEDILGSDLWKSLTDMDAEYDALSTKYTITNPVISKNGFKIELDKKDGAFVSGEITEVATMIPFYGIAELRDTIRMYQSNGEFSDLGSVRPTAVINYITNEVIRIVQQSPRPPDLCEIKEWIDMWQMYLKHIEPQCLHCKDIFVPIYYLRGDCSQSS